MEFLADYLELNWDVFVEKRVAPLLNNDQIYQTDIADLTELETQIDELKLDRANTDLIADYFACAHSASSRAQELAYLSGWRDCLRIFVR